MARFNGSPSKLVIRDENASRGMIGTKLPLTAIAWSPGVPQLHFRSKLLVCSVFLGGVSSMSNLRAFGEAKYSAVLSNYFSIEACKETDTPKQLAECFNRYRKEK